MSSILEQRKHNAYLGRNYRFQNIAKTHTHTYTHTVAVAIIILVAMSLHARARRYVCVLLGIGTK